MPKPTAKPLASLPSEALLSGLPSVETLGRRLSMVQQAHDRLDAAMRDRSTDTPAPEYDLRPLHDQARALRDLIATIPPASVTDAVVHVQVAAISVGFLSSCEMTASEIHDSALMVERLLFTALPILAAAAGMRNADYNAASSAKLGTNRWAALENLAEARAETSSTAPGRA